MEYLSLSDKIKLSLKAANNLNYIWGKKKMSPPIIAWLLTKRCNLTCIHCTSYLSRDKIESDRLLSLAHKIAESNCMIVILSGGEPLLIPNIREIIKILKAAGKIVKINTNGLNMHLFNDFILENKIDAVCVSLDGADAEMHDSIRGKKGSFETAIKNLKYLKSNRKNGKPFLEVRGVVMKNNYHSISDYVKVIGKVADDIKFQPIHDLESHHAVVDKEVLFDDDLKDFNKVFDSFLKEHKSFDKSYYRKFQNFLSKDEQMKVDALNSCLQSWMIFMPVVEDGSCLSCSHKIGNLYDSSVEEIWSGEERLSFLRSLAHFGKCNTPCWLNCTGVSPELIGKGIKKMLKIKKPTTEAYEAFKKTPHYTG